MAVGKISNTNSNYVLLIFKLFISLLKSTSSWIISKAGPDEEDIDATNLIIGSVLSDINNESQERGDNTADPKEQEHKEVATKAKNKRY